MSDEERKNSEDINKQALNDDAVASENTHSEDEATDSDGIADGASSIQVQAQTQVAALASRGLALDSPEEIDEPDTPDQRWMVTLADLLSLILTFFVLLFSMSTLELEQWEKISQSLSQNLSLEKKVKETKPAAEQAIEKINRLEAAPLGYLNTIISDTVSKNETLHDAIHIELLDDRLVISVVGERMFKRGQDLTTLTEEGATTVAMVGDIIGSINNHIDIYGNASPEPINSDIFPSNWELSMARALVVSQLLRKRGYEYKINSFGRSHANFGVLTYLPEEEREALSRRVDIIIRDYPKEE